MAAIDVDSPEAAELETRKRARSESEREQAKAEAKRRQLKRDRERRREKRFQILEEMVTRFNARFSQQGPAIVPAPITHTPAVTTPPTPPSPTFGSVASDLPSMEAEQKRETTNLSQADQTETTMMDNTDTVNFVTDNSERLGGSTHPNPTADEYSTKTSKKRRRPSPPPTRPHTSSGWTPIEGSPDDPNTHRCKRVKAGRATTQGPT
jgi:hypothetical protein